MTDDDKKEEKKEEKEETELSFIEKERSKLHDWFVTKGWIYLMVFIMGILLGGLMFK